MTRYHVTPFPFQSPKSFYDIGIGAETLKPRPEWAHIKERDMGHTPTPWAAEIDGSGRIIAPSADGIPYVARFSNLNDMGYAINAVNSHASLVEKVERLREALTPSGETKAAYMGEFSIGFPDVDENGIEYTRKINVPWTTIKEIMAAIRERANA